MTPDDRDFEQAVAGGFRAMRERRGPCPEAKLLSAYAAGELAAAESVTVRDHVAVCGLCDALVERMKNFDSEVPPAGWAATEKRLRWRVFGGERSWWKSAGHFLYRPSLAYGIAVAAVICAYLGVLTRERAPAPAPAPPALVAARIIDLNLVRGGITEVTLRPGEESLVLSFFVPARPGFRYTASIDASGAVDIASFDGKGNFSVVWRRDRPGEHRLKVAELDPRTGREELKAEFRFRL